MKVVIFSAGMPVVLFESDDLESITSFIDSNRRKYQPNSLFVDFGHRDDHEAQSV